MASRKGYCQSLVGNDPIPMAGEHLYVYRPCFAILGTFLVITIMVIMNQPVTSEPNWKIILVVMDYAYKPGVCFHAIMCSASIRSSSVIADYVRHIIIVNDKSRDTTAEIINNLAASDKRIALNMQKIKAWEEQFYRNERPRIRMYILKLDGDGQMDSKYIPDLLEPLVKNGFHFAKGNRFNDFHALRQMPLYAEPNLMLSFYQSSLRLLSVFDPTNGFLHKKKL